MIRDIEEAAYGLNICCTYFYIVSSTTWAVFGEELKTVQIGKHQIHML